MMNQKELENYFAGAPAVVAGGELVNLVAWLLPIPKPVKVAVSVTAAAADAIIAGIGTKEIIERMMNSKKESVKKENIKKAE